MLPVRLLWEGVMGNELGQLGWMRRPYTPSQAPALLATLALLVWRGLRSAM